MSRGILITLEGGEGCGKSTQIKLLAAFLKKQGCRVFVTREPGGTRVSEAVRQVLLDPAHRGMSGVCETLLYMASRSELVRQIIKPHLDKGEVVLCDRWLDATVAYQGFGEGVNVDWIRGLGREATLHIAPKLSLYLDLPVVSGLRRAKKRHRADRIERKAIAFHERVRQGYLWIARREPKRFKRIAITEKDPIAAVHEKIKKEVMRVL